MLSFLVCFALRSSVFFFSGAQLKLAVDFGGGGISRFFVNGVAITTYGAAPDDPKKRAPLASGMYAEAIGLGAAVEFLTFKSGPFEERSEAFFGKDNSSAPNLTKAVVAAARIAPHSAALKTPPKPGSGAHLL
eukprot:GHVU01147653.1.p1 GENE.GHVU01147653.1~~GHVU01147653.1.p1  ORF type:complete len:133 (-),score=12.88 GHVU01147653.1:352-750(-)